MENREQVTPKQVDEYIRILETRFRNGEDDKELYNKKLKNLKIIKEILKGRELWEKTKNLKM